ncbi:hypothetical protein C8J57DRAFT_1716689 [Mycena rebaudengoi]|nr:hypothetical protein C8J57DRAFT_1716689 [Mycena rebaudengoi]
MITSLGRLIVRAVEEKASPPVQSLWVPSSVGPFRVGAAHRHSSLLDAVGVFTPPSTRPVSRATSSSLYSTPYAVPSLASSGSPPAAVKEEQPDNDGFIIDLASAPLPQALAPPTEVPHRATQASARMRRMMGVFRLNPFAMHAHGGRGVTVFLRLGRRFAS